MGKCRKIDIEQTKRIIKDLKCKNDEISQKIDYFNDMIKTNTLNNKILNFEKNNIRTEINSDSFIECYDCYCRSEKCDNKFNGLISMYHELLNELNFNKSKYNNIVNILLDIKKYLEDNNSNEYSDIYVYIKNDRYRNLVCILYDFSKFDIDRNKLLEVVGLYGEYHFNRNKLEMSLKYNKTYGNLEVVDLLTGKPTFGHATIALESLDDIVERLNMLIEGYNNFLKLEGNCAKKIKNITGNIGPDTSLMSSIQLIEFYRKRGFYKEGSFGKKI